MEEERMLKSAVPDPVLPTSTDRLQAEATENVPNLKSFAAVAAKKKSFSPLSMEGKAEKFSLGCKYRKIEGRVATLLPPPEEVEKVRKRTVSYRCVNLKTRMPHPASKMQVEKALESIWDSVSHASRGKGYGVTDIQFISEELALANSMSPFFGDDFVLYPTYMGRRTVNLYVNDIPPHVDLWSVLACVAIGGVDSIVKVDRSESKIWDGVDLEVTLRVTKEEFNSIPEIISVPGIELIRVVVEGRKKRCDLCGATQHLKSQCPSKIKKNGVKTRGLSESSTPVPTTSKEVFATKATATATKDKTSDSDVRMKKKGKRQHKMEEEQRPKSPVTSSKKRITETEKSTTAAVPVSRMESPSTAAVSVSRMESPSTAVVPVSRMESSSTAAVPVSQIDLSSTAALSVSSEEVPSAAMSASFIDASAAMTATIVNHPHFVLAKRSEPLVNFISQHEEIKKVEKGKIPFTTPTNYQLYSLPLKAFVLLKEEFGDDVGSPNVALSVDLLKGLPKSPTSPLNVPGNITRPPEGKS
ncbi:hypothetical protein Ahia01_000868800 [Argonauta hians]